MPRRRYGGFGFPPYVPVAARRARAQRELAESGAGASPVVIDGRTIAHTFWGKAWCENLEAYSDYANRLPRGRSYVRNGSVVDLSIGERTILAKVSGSLLYTVEIEIRSLPKERWAAIQRECAGKIDSLVELLGGRLSDAVLGVITRRPGGLFPSPAEIALSCSCPDVATLCKHVAATLYGVGARLDAMPELLFRLRGLDALELVSAASSAAALASDPGSSALAGTDLAGLFGIELEDGAPPVSTASPSEKPKPKRKREPERLLARDLVAAGVSRAKLQQWLRAGALLPTGDRGVYFRTPATALEMKKHLAAPARRARKRKK